jgi:hypothetical protein
MDPLFLQFRQSLFDTDNPIDIDYNLVVVPNICRSLFPDEDNDWLSGSVSSSERPQSKIFTNTLSRIACSPSHIVSDGNPRHTPPTFVEFSHDGTLSQETAAGTVTHS